MIPILNTNINTKNLVHVRFFVSCNIKTIFVPPSLYFMVVFIIKNAQTGCKKKKLIAHGEMNFNLYARKFKIVSSLKFIKVI